MKRLFGGALALAAVVALSATPVLAGQFQVGNNFVVDGTYSADGLALSGGWSDGGGIKKQHSYSSTGSIGESDLLVTLDETGLKTVDYSGHSGGYAIQENDITSGGWSYSVSGVSVSGSLVLDLSIPQNGGGEYHNH